MSITLGKKIADLRKEKGITQDELSEKLGVSPQAISKWENDVSCPDIMTLPKLAQVFDISIDELLSSEPKRETYLQPIENRKNFDDLVLRIYVNSDDGDKVKVNLPMPLVKLGLEIGMDMPTISGNSSLKNINFNKLIEMVEKGLIGKLVEVESADGDTVEIVVE